MQILIKQLENQLGAASTDSVLCTGDARKDMGRDLLKVLEGVVNANGKKDAYYVLAHTKPDPQMPRLVRTTVMLHKNQPPKMLGTICFHVDNRAGRVRRLWVLPLDTPATALATGHTVPEVAAAARGMPLIHG